MIYLYNTLIIIAAFVGMEVVAWALHKYVMHKSMWHLHKDHHIDGKKGFQRNDYFAMVFGIPSWLFIMFGIMGGCDYRLYIGIGITLYGICYMIVHDGIIHQRFGSFKNTKNKYIIALKKGHYAHHKFDRSKDHNKDNDVSYGMLWVPYKFFKEASVEESDK